MNRTKNRLAGGGKGRAGHRQEEFSAAVEGLSSCSTDFQILTCINGALLLLCCCQHDEKLNSILLFCEHFFALFLARV